MGWFDGPAVGRLVSVYAGFVPSGTPVFGELPLVVNFLLAKPFAAYSAPLTGFIEIAQQKNPLLWRSLNRLPALSCCWLHAQGATDGKHVRAATLQRNRILRHGQQI